MAKKQTIIDSKAKFKKNQELYYFVLARKLSIYGKCSECGYIVKENTVSSYWQTNLPHYLNRIPLDNIFNEYEQKYKNICLERCSFGVPPPVNNSYFKEVDYTTILHSNPHIINPATPKVTTSIEIRKSNIIRRTLTYYKEPRYYMKIVNIMGKLNYFHDRDIGRVIFFTEEEAKEKLKNLHNEIELKNLFNTIDEKTLLKLKNFTFAMERVSPYDGEIEENDRNNFDIKKYFKYRL